MTVQEAVLAIDEKEQRLADTAPDFEAAVRVAKWLRMKRQYASSSTDSRWWAERWPKEDLPA
jgi:hypothetical protein